MRIRRIMPEQWINTSSLYWINANCVESVDVHPEPLTVDFGLTSGKTLRLHDSRAAHVLRRLGLDPEAIADVSDYAAIMDDAGIPIGVVPAH